MKIKCEGCGIKIKDSEESCPHCGHVLYSGVFGDISQEVDRELSNVSESEIEEVRRQMNGSSAKMSFSEFREYFIQSTGKRPPLLPKSRMNFEYIVQMQYNAYLRNFGK